MLYLSDSNLYRYHLQFGVLTINEVRAKLGLAPVAWGERPASPVDALNHPSTQSGSTGEDPTENESEEINEMRSERSAER